MRNKYRFLILVAVFLFSFLHIFPAVAVAEEAGTINNTAINSDTGASNATKNVAVLSPKEFIFGTIQFLCMALIVYFLMVINPSKTKDEEHKQFLDNLKKNDEVLTSSGLYGKIVSISPEQINLEISPNVKVRFDPKHILPLPKQASNAK